MPSEQEIREPQRRNPVAGFVIVVALQLAALGSLVGAKEALLRTGQTVKLELAPVDPRSLLQGDYIRLNYKISTPPEDAIPSGRYRVQLVLSPDENGVHQFKRLYEDSTALEANEVIITGWVRENQQLVFGIESFFIPENTGRTLEQTAKYGIVKVSKTGDALLVGVE
jgi:uncharacterized membrane-anchored protein